MPAALQTQLELLAPRLPHATNVANGPAVELLNRLWLMSPALYRRR